MNKKQARTRRALRTRARIRSLGVHRLTVTRTPRHVYAQVMNADGSAVLASASTLDKSLREAIGTAETSTRRQLSVRPSLSVRLPLV